MLFCSVNLNATSYITHYEDEEYNENIDREDVDYSRNKQVLTLDKVPAIPLPLKITNSDKPIQIIDKEVNFEADDYDNEYTEKDAVVTTQNNSNDEIKARHGPEPEVKKIDIITRLGFFLRAEVGNAKGSHKFDTSQIENYTTIPTNAQEMASGCDGGTSGGCWRDNGVLSIDSKNGKKSTAIGFGYDFSDRFSLEMYFGHILGSSTTENRGIEFYELNGQGYNHINGSLIYPTVDYLGWGQYNIASTISQRGKMSLINGYYNFDAGNGFKPFVTAGIGIARVTEQISYSYNLIKVGCCDFPSAGQIGNGVFYALPPSVEVGHQLYDPPVITFKQTMGAYQLGLGIAYELNKFMDIEAIYRHSGTFKKTKLAGKRISNSSINLGIKIKL